MQYARSADGFHAIINYHHVWLEDLKYVDLFFGLEAGTNLTREDVRQRAFPHSSDRVVLKSLNEFIAKGLLHVGCEVRVINNQSQVVSVYWMPDALRQSIKEWNDYLAPGKRNDG